MRTLRLQCECGRNLADVTFIDYNPDWTRDKLTVSARPNVKMDSYRPWDAANRGGVIGAPGRAAATSGRIEGVDFDWFDHTYTWHCRCGRTPTRRHERIGAKWIEYEPAATPIVILILGRDL